MRRNPNFTNNIDGMEPSGDGLGKGGEVFLPLVFLHKIVSPHPVLLLFVVSMRVRLRRCVLWLLCSDPLLLLGYQRKGGCIGILSRDLCGIFYQAGKLVSETSLDVGIGVSSLIAGIG